MRTSARISRAIATSSVTRAQATSAWNVIYLPLVAYPLLVMYFQEEDLTALKNKALMTFLPKMRFNRNTACTVVYGPKSRCGLGIKTYTWSNQWNKSRHSSNTSDYHSH